MPRASPVLAIAIFLLLGTDCGHLTRKPPFIRIHLPPQASRQKADKKEAKKTAGENQDRIKIKSKTLKRLDSIRKKLGASEDFLASKRAEGLDVAKAEEILKNSKNLFEQTEKLYLEANISEEYGPILGMLAAIEGSLEKIREEARKAPRFREKTEPKPREFKDARDAIIEKLGHPDPRNVRVGPMASFSFDIPDPTSALNAAVRMGCFNPRTGIFTLFSPPKVMVIEYRQGVEGTYQFVLVEDNPNIERFTAKQTLGAQERDEALVSLCQSQGAGYEDYKFIAAYKGKMAGTPEDYLRQLLSGRFRFADQFGVGALSENAKADAPLANLELVSIVFDTEIAALVRTQTDAINTLRERLFDPKEGIAKEFDTEKIDRTKRAFAKIFSWENTLSPQKRDKKRFLRIIGKDPKAEIALDQFEDSIDKLAKNLNRLQRELLRFKKDYGDELVFYDDQNPVMLLLLRGVGFETDQASARTLFKKDTPRITAETKLYYIRNKYDRLPPLTREAKIKISEANKYIDVSKNYQRLTSFMLGWPSSKPLPAGRYKIDLKITDEIREKAIVHEVNFTVLPAILKKQGEQRRVP